MHLSRRVATLTVAATLAITSLGVAGSAEALPRPKPKELQLQVLSFNDFHGHLEPPGGADATMGAQLDPNATPVGGCGVSGVHPRPAAAEGPQLPHGGRR
jgi:5'-nucleotidase